MESLRSKLAEYGQEHLLNFWEDLNDQERAILEEDIRQLDLREITSYFERAKACLATNAQFVDNEIEPIPKEKFASEETSGRNDTDLYRNTGLQAISKGLVAVVVLAGGQGTRLGVNYPKGMYNIGLPSDKTLFQIQAERILKVQKLAKDKFQQTGIITWYILTSEATHDATLEYLEENNYFDLKEENVKVFKQGMLPCFTTDGKLILDQKYRISKAPDGNGGLYRALKVQGILDDMKKRGIQIVHVHSVDNILVKVADPTFLGYCFTVEADCGVKVVEKSSPAEPIGIVCKVNDHYRVVEYSEITKEISELRRSDGKLMYNAGNICNHYFTVDFLVDVVNSHEMELQVHAAYKKIPFVDDKGERHVPERPNGIKIEKFIFDVFKFAKNFTAWESRREEEFSPVKNADSIGQDCPSTARRDLFKLHKEWLLRAGAIKVNCDVEISPFVSYEGEGLRKRAEGHTFVDGPILLSMDCFE